MLLILLILLLILLGINKIRSRSHTTLKEAFQGPESEHNLFVTFDVGGEDNLSQQEVETLPEGVEQDWQEDGVTETEVRKVKVAGDHAPPDQVKGDGGESMKQKGGQLGDVVKHQRVLPDNQGQTKAAQGETVVCQKPNI